MTLCMAWVRSIGDSSELVFVSDSRLRSLGSWDCNPKIFTFARTDCAICFSGVTEFSYPMMIQLKNEVELNPKIQSRHQRLTVFKGILVRVLNSMLEHKSDFEVPKVEFLFGGYCWFYQEFKLWKFSYDTNLRRFIAKTINYWKEAERDLRIAFSGDYIEDAQQRLLRYMKSRATEAESIDMEPVEVLRDMLLSDNADSEYPCIGGAPQLLKVYRSLNRVPFCVQWIVNGETRTTLFGHPIKQFRRMPLPVLDPTTMTYLNSNAFGT